MSSYLSDIYESLKAREKYIPPEWQFISRMEKDESDNNMTQHRNRACCEQPLHDTALNNNSKDNHT